MQVHDYRREALGFGHEIKDFEAMGSGRYAVKGVGQGVKVGDHLRFTLKGSQALELRLQVLEVRHKIVPENSWSAVLEGDDFASLDIHRWSIVCDGCQSKMDFEFSAAVGAEAAGLAAAAGLRIEGLGWATRGQDHICPTCHKEES